MDDIAEYFQLASHNFYENNYIDGLQYLTKCLNLDPHNSSILSNKSLFYSQLGDLDNSIQSLQKSIQSNPLNYVAYFNLFSLLYREDQIEQAFQNLCCSLSCLYLVRARKDRKQIDVQKSLKYGENNVEAHLLKCMMYLDYGKNKLALNQVQWALDIKGENQTLKKVHSIVNKKIDPDYIPEKFSLTSKKTQSYRLRTTYEPSQDLETEIRQKIDEFNNLYSQLNEIYGTIMQRVPRVKKDNESQFSMREIRESEIYNFKYGSRNCEGQIILDKGIEDYQTKEQLPGDNQKDRIIKVEKKGSQASIDQKIEERDSKEQKSEEFHDKTELDSLKNPSVSAEYSSCSSKQIQLYPIKNHKKIQFTFINFQAEQNKYKDIYLTGNYINENYLKFKTEIKKSQDSICYWYDVYPPTKIPKDCQKVKVKLFNKQYFSYFDENVGEGEIVINHSGDNKISIFREGEFAGIVNLKIDLL